MRSIILWECLALLGTLFLCGAPANALVGGDLVDISLQRYTVAIRSTKGGCTGVVLAQDIVLTAAHCTQNAQNLWVGGNRGWGSLNNPPVGLSAVTENVQHPRYNPDKAGSPDLALLKLEKPLPDRFLPAFLGARMPDSGDGLIATGYHGLRRERGKRSNSGHSPAHGLAARFPHIRKRPSAGQHARGACGIGPRRFRWSSFRLSRDAHVSGNHRGPFGG
jgi:hypothetical protein